MSETEYPRYGKFDAIGKGELSRLLKELIDLPLKRPIRPEALEPVEETEPPLRLARAALSPRFRLQNLDQNIGIELVSEDAALMSRGALAPTRKFDPAVEHLPLPDCDSFITEQCRGT
jgi:hypothetical protein